MKKRIGIECASAAALAVKLAKVDVVAAYPITPQTHIAEVLSEYVANGEIDAEYINVESEHSALSACIGASAVGARVFTATCGPGLALMHELLPIAAGWRLPIVMANTNRSLSPNLNIWGDQSDSMASRDCGWIQIFVENAQEIFDSIIMAYKIAEDERVLLPVMVNFKGFYCTHVIEPLTTLDQEEVDKFLPPKKIPEYALNPDSPTTWGCVAFPDVQTELKKQWDSALRGSLGVIKEIFKEYGDLFGRNYDIVETYKMDDAEIGFMLTGYACGTCRVVVDMLRKNGEKVGMIKLRVFRPFPFNEITKVVGDLKALAVFDEAISVGGVGGPLFGETRSALYSLKKKPKVLGFIHGIGGRDIRVEDFLYAYEKTKKVLSNEEKLENDFILSQVRE
ncbi:MAG: pyruvate ferredoxin oxidoreductase [Nitrososphaerota archaeon]|nr:pyruvate ferredoxin oxidoreductase [Candidatus Bathyarchaeota archaeon]MDW8023008.1 pyruvate ferredoxin oxidoreductase [Nitrososphaerota archaeon]